jgi:hypothetical protein
MKNIKNHFVMVDFLVKMKLVPNVAGTHKRNKVNLVTQADFFWSKHATEL